MLSLESSSVDCHNVFWVFPLCLFVTRFQLCMESGNGNAPSGLSVSSFSLQLFGSCFVVALHSLPVLWTVLCVLALLPYAGVEQAVCPSLSALSALLPLCSRGLLPDALRSRAPPCFSQVSHWSSAGSAFHCLSLPHELMYGNAASPPAVWCRCLCLSRTRPG